MSMKEVKPFHEWKKNIKKEMYPEVRDRYWYYQEYGKYCLKIRMNDIRSNEDET